MPRQKNDGRGRLGGRAKGTPNRLNKNVKAWLQSFVTGQRRQIEQDFALLEPAERVRAFEKLLAYVTPKQQAVSQTIDFSALSEADLDVIISKITSNDNT